MKHFLSQYKFETLLLFIFLLAEILVNPLGEFPLNDDWSYAKTVLILQNEGRLYIGHWCAMSLASHAVWGFLFIKAFGFSFFVLRISTLVSSLIGLLFLFKLIFSISKNKYVAFIAALTLLLNPMYFNLSNTFMTDINFNTLLILSIYTAFRFFETKKIFHFILFFFLSITLVLCRQFGLIFPASLVVSLVFFKPRNWRIICLSILGLIVVVLVLKWYESYLWNVLPRYSHYLYSKEIWTDHDFFIKLEIFFTIRHQNILMQVLFYCSPFLIIYFSIKSMTQYFFKVIIALSICFLIMFVWLNDAVILTGNIFTNMALGPDTFHEIFDDNNNSLPNHNYNQYFESIFYFVKRLFAFISCLILLLLLFKNKNSKNQQFEKGTKILFLFSLMASYSAMVFISSSNFDRYSLPIITIVLIAFSFVESEEMKPKFFHTLLLISFAYCALFGTKDYLEVNRTKWKAINYLKKEKHIEQHQINAGFEYNNWYEGVNWSWYVDIQTLKSFPYLIQYKKEPGYKVYKEFEFQRYFPFKKDKINIFVRDTIK